MKRKNNFNKGFAVFFGVLTMVMIFSKLPDDLVFRVIFSVIAGVVNFFLVLMVIEK